MSKDIAKSPEMLQKEAVVADLQQAVKKKKSTLKSLKTRLENTRKKIETIQRETQLGIVHKMEDLDKLRMEIADLAAQLKKSKNMSEEDKRELGRMAEEFSESTLGDEFEEYKASKAKMESGDFDYEEEFGNRVRDAFEQFKVQPDEVEKKDIRKVFLNLSKKFHPDKSESKEQAEEYHVIMQKINEAYQNNDIETLLEMERNYLMEEPDFENTGTVDALQQKIDYLNRELAFITNQVERVSNELKNLRQSDIGKMLTANDRAERHGEGLDVMQAHLEDSIRMFTKLKEGLEDSIRRDEISPKMNDFLMEAMKIGMESGNMDTDDMMELMSEMMGEMMGGEMFDAPEFVENPKFPRDSSVRVVKSFQSPIGEEADMKGWEGRVVYAYYEDDEITYLIDFDSVTMDDAMSDAYIKSAVDFEENFQSQAFNENDLKAVKPRDLSITTFATFRKHLHKYAWNYLSKKQRDRIVKIMMKDPEDSDAENWLAYLKENLKTPVNVETAGHLENPPGLKAKIVKMGYANPQYGVMVYIKRPGYKGQQEYPLLDLMCSGKNKNRQILEDYQEWAEERIDAVDIL